MLKKGVHLKVRVNDPIGLLPQIISGPMSSENLIVGVRYANGAFQGATNFGIGKVGRDYEMVIPAGVPLRLWVFSRHVTLSDTKGSPVDNLGALLPFQANPGQDQSFTLTVAGHVPVVEAAGRP